MYESRTRRSRNLRHPTENTDGKLLFMASKHKIAVSKSDIDKSHRVTKFKMNENCPVIVKFTNSSARQRVLEAKKSLGDGIYVQEGPDTISPKSGIPRARQLVKAKTLEKRGLLVSCLW